MTDRASTFVWIDGLSVDPALAQVSVFDRGFLYGDSVFETLRAYGGKPFRLRDHLERLFVSAEQVRLQLPWSLASLERELAEAVGVSGLDDAYVRLTISRGAGALGLRPDRARTPRRVLIVSPLPRPRPGLYEEGITAILHRIERPHERASLTTVPKFAHYLASILALEAAEERGADDALFVDEDDCVLEGATSNLFWAEGGRLHTAPLGRGVLDGLTRRTVVELARLANIPFEEIPLERGRLEAVDELFLTSSIRELVAVVRVDDLRIGTGRPGSLFRRLGEAYRRVVRQGA